MTIAELLATVRRIEVRTNRLVNDMMVGAYLSHFKGRGMDFEELREYIPGDEVRDIDWNVTYRMGRPFVKRFREERELALLIAVDVSASSAFGSLRRTKREFAAEVASTLAVSAARNGDKVGLLLFSDQVELYLPPRKGRRHILRLIREMLFFKPKHTGTNIPAGLAFLNHVLRRRAIVFLLTDFLHSFGDQNIKPGTPRNAGSSAGGEAGIGRDALQEVGLTNARHDLVCLHLHDPRESKLPPAGLLTVEAAETGELVELDSSRSAVRYKFEVRNPKQMRNSKEFQNSDLLRDVSASVNIGVPGDKTVKTVVLSRGRAGTPLKRGVNESDWKCLIRFSDLFRVSNFGFRVLALAFIFLPLPAFTATNISTAGDDLPQLRPPRAEIPPSFWENYGVWVIAGCILLVALIGVAVWPLTRPKPPIMIAPPIRAKQTLEPLLTKAENGLVLSQVSQALRHYAIEAFGLPPVDQTSMDFRSL